jgi:hypothetical protein
MHDYSERVTGLYYTILAYACQELLFCVIHTRYFEHVVCAKVRHIVAGMEPAIDKL